MKIMSIQGLVSTVILILFLVMALNAQSLRRMDKIQNLSDEKIINLMMSKDSEKAMLASKEIFARGEQMIPLLLKLEGNSKCFYGQKALGDWDTPGLSRIVPNCNARSTYQITVETAALYLISAIFNEDLKFSYPPVLCDFSSEEKKCAEAGNTPERITKAWQATKSWYLSLKTEGLNYLREENQDPLKNSGLAF